MWDWAMSPGGQAVATWGSAVLSLFAIMLALIVAVREQKRANQDLLREALREKERRRLFIDAALEISKEAVPIIRRAFDEFKISFEPETRPVDQNSLAHRLQGELQPIHDAALALRNATPFDAPIALNVARLCRAIERSWDDTAAYQQRLGAVLEQQLWKVEDVEHALLEERALD